MTPASAPLATAKGANAKSARMREVNEDMTHDPRKETYRPPMTPACVRVSPGKEDGCDLKPFKATQRVRRPPGKGGARQPEASLARAAATAFVKRRQRALKPCGSLEIMKAPKPSPCWVRGQHRSRRHGQPRPIRPGSQSRAKAREGSPGNLRGPVVARTEKPGTLERRVNKAPGPAVGSNIAGSATANTNDRARTEPRGEDISRRACAAGRRSGFIVPQRAGNRARRDPSEGRGPPRD